MKHLQYLATSALAIIIVLSFQACSSDEGILTETETITIPGLDTMTVENTFIFQNVSSGQTEDFNGVFFTCTEDDNLYVNLLVFGPDFRVVNGEPQSDEDYFVQSWLSQGPLSPGVYLTEGEFISSDPVINPEPFFEITILEANEFIVRGSFKSVSLDAGPWFVDVSGEFNLQSYDCALLEIEPGDIEDWSEYANGRATIFQNGTEDVVIAAGGFCEDLILDQQSAMGVFAFGGLIAVYDGELDVGPGNQTDLVLLKEEASYESGVSYEGVYFAAPTDMDIILPQLTWEEIKPLAQSVTVEFIELGQIYIAGKIFDTSGKVIVDFNASRFIECG